MSQRAISPNILGRISLFGEPGHRAGHIFADHIEFEVNLIAWLKGLHIGMFIGIGDDGQIEPGLFDVEDGKTDAVEADGAFLNNEVAEFFGEFEAEFPTAVQFFTVQTGSGGIDMALDDMAVQSSVHPQASFEVDEVARLPAIDVGSFECFPDGGHPVEVVPGLFDG